MKEHSNTYYMDLRCGYCTYRRKGSGLKAVSSTCTKIRAWLLPRPDPCCWAQVVFCVSLSGSKIYVRFSYYSCYVACSQCTESGTARSRKMRNNMSACSLQSVDQSDQTTTETGRRSQHPKKQT